MEYYKLRLLFIFFQTILISSLFEPPLTWSQNKSTKSYEEAQSFFKTANELVQKGNYSKAVEIYHKAIKSDPLRPAPHYNLANVLVATGKIDAAVKEYKLAIKINPMIPDYHRNLGFAYALMKKGDLAKKKYEELKKLDSTQADILMQWIQSGRQPSD